MPKLAAGKDGLVPSQNRPTGFGGDFVLHYGVVFLVIALIAAVFGFGGVAAAAAGTAKLLFFVFAAMAVAAFVTTFARRS